MQDRTGSYGQQNFYPRPPRGGRHAESSKERTGQQISIHALREEGDVKTGYQRTTVLHFYPRPPRGGRQFCQRNRAGANKFLSTPSARRATALQEMQEKAPKISIHALREEGDACPPMLFPCSWYFYPRPPRGGRPGIQMLQLQVCYFYPRPPRGGRPISRAGQSLQTSHFYPRPPRGGRPDSPAHQLTTHTFLPTPSARRATPKADGSHRSRRFLSTPSARRATVAYVIGRGLPDISIHALREEGDAQANALALQEMQFLSTPSARRATLCRVFHREH